MSLQPDHSQTDKMLALLAPNTDKFVFQVFDDNTERKKANKGYDIFARTLAGTLQDRHEQLTQLNNKGVGVYVTINEVQGSRRLAETVTAIRGLYVDFDTQDADRVNRLTSLELKPSMIVESSPNKHHAYWLADGIPLDKFTEYQKRLIEFFTGTGDAPDKAIHDLPRVMRLAGYYHLKVKAKDGLTGKPFMTRVVYEGKRYEARELIEWLDSMESLPALPMIEQASNSKRYQHTPTILPQAEHDSQLSTLTADKVRALSRGHWSSILNALGYGVSSDPKAHTPCPVCSGSDRFRFDDEHGKGTFICSQGTGEPISGDGFSLLADHAGMGVSSAIQAITGALSAMGLVSPDDLKSTMGGDWDAPKAILTDLPPVKTITKDMLPDSLWRYVDNQAERLSVPHEYVAIPLVTALAGIIGTKVSIFPKFLDDWEIVPNLWGAIIGNPSTKKTPSISAGMKPLHNLTYKAKAEYEQAQKEFATYKEINKHKAKALDDELKAMAKKQAKQADDDEAKVTDDDMLAKAQAIAEATNADEFEPKLKRYIANDSTYQKLGEMLSQTSNGLVIERDELTGLLASLDGESNSEARNFYLEAFNGTGSHIMDRIGRGSVFIESHCLSIIGGIQPNKLERYLERTIKGLDNDGMMQRFQLAVYPDHMKGRKENDIAPDKDIRQVVYDLFETIDNMSEWDFINYGANESDEYHKRPYYRFSKEAYDVFMPWYDQLKAEADDAEHSVIAEHMTKYPNTVASLALIFHLVDCIEYQANLGAVSKTALKTAIEWHLMLETHMNRIYSLVTDSSNIKASYLADKLKAMVKKGGDKDDKTDWLYYGFTARQLIRRGWKSLTDTDEVLNALEVLTEHDWLRWETVESTGQGGRPTERYYINPRIKDLI